MDSMTFVFSQKITGQQRKYIASAIGEAIGGSARYLGVPSYAYAVGGWSIDKDSVLWSPDTHFSEREKIKPVLDALNAAGFIAVGSANIYIPAEDFTETAAMNVSNLVTSKASLIKKSLDAPNDIGVTNDTNEISFNFFNATLKSEELLAYITLVWRLAELAKSLKKVSPVEKPVENEKYAFRCFLLRLGFIGNEFKDARRVLLANMEGNGAFRQTNDRIQTDVDTRDSFNPVSIPHDNIKTLPSVNMDNNSGGELLKEAV